ncbi:Swt1 family HEPN domain-containing protein [Aliiroseovarius sp. S2029]|uniref:Swt1 family HEPN domain-containing protein n=1 Tax=Aliiroseovarius sp. S2029 TaxID=2936988 RepID=UPI0020BE3E48|nr:Swt1 family HEPN domain-containing protein [Aliiroseovarius sp. S2029]MCK8485214.1 Swt1 family HEPN domain-containing protein [Aliiroseovarius sp. S2029]
MADRTDELYPFIYRGLLTEESLDKAGRNTRAKLDGAETEAIKEKLSYDMLEDSSLVSAKRMSLVYTAIHAFENMVRDYVKSTLIDAHREAWWEKVPEKIKKKVNTRMEDDAKFKWHGTRGGSEMEYCDFGDLSSIIVVNREDFELTLSDIEWAKSVLSVLERSRNIVMHGGVLAVQDIERIGGNIRDWIRQVG